MNRGIVMGIILSIFWLFSSCGSGTPLSEYQPQNQSEKELTHALLRHTEARIAGGIEKILSGFYDDCQVNLHPYVSLTKRQLAEVEIDDWTFDGKLNFFDPKFEITGDTAKVSVKVKIGVAGTRMNIFTMIKENNEWLISKLVLVDL
jgi:hypothetical protein